MLKALRREPGFYRNLFALAMPMILQNLITTSLGFVDTFMVGLVGRNQLSAVTAANTPIFMLQVVIFGMMSGLTVMVSQYWGQQDMESINRCMGVVTYIGLATSAIFAAAFVFLPYQVMSIVTDNALLIELGAPYLRIVGVSYVFNAVSSVYVSMQRSTENPMFGMLVFGVSMLANTILNYILIFGKLGLPAMGITGAAIATLSSRVLEPPRSPDPPRHADPRHGHSEKHAEILRPRADQRISVGLGCIGADLHSGTHDHLCRYAGRSRHHGQHRQILHRGLLRSGRCRRRHHRQAHR